MEVDIYKSCCAHLSSVPLLKRLKQMFVRWLFDVDEVKVGNSVIIRPDSIVFETLSANPTLMQEGQLWYRADLGRFAYYDGSRVRYVAKSSDCVSH